jgi:predicted NBD/HSP70 family sugar kinase
MPAPCGGDEIGAHHALRRRVATIGLMTMTGDQQLLKRINRMALVRCVRSLPAPSRSDLATHTGLTKSTISLLAQELIDEGWLCERGRAITGSLGRRPTPLALDDSRLALIGVELGVGTLTVVTTSLTGQLLHNASEALPDLTPQAVCALIVQRMAEAAADVQASHRRLLGFGLGVPGAVDERSGVVRVAPNLGWREVPMRRLLSAGLRDAGFGQVPLHVQNEADVAALGEFEFSPPPVPEPLIYLSLDVGVGAGIVLNDRLFTGAQGLAGEVGHTLLERDGPACSCGRHGCAEAFIGLRAMALRAGIAEAGVEPLRQALARADSAAAEAVQRAGDCLGVLLQNLWMNFNPARFVLGGPTCELGEVFLGAAQRSLARFAAEAGLAAPPVVACRFGREAVAVGAAALVLHQAVRPFHERPAAR